MADIVEKSWLERKRPIKKRWRAPSVDRVEVCRKQLRHQGGRIRLRWIHQINIEALLRAAGPNLKRFLKDSHQSKFPAPAGATIRYLDPISIVAILSDKTGIRRLYQHSGPFFLCRPFLLNTCMTSWVSTASIFRLFLRCGLPIHRLIKSHQR